MRQAKSPSEGKETVDIPDVAKLFGINRSTAYELARRDELPVPVIRLGRRMVVSKQALEEVLAARKNTNVA